VGLGVAEASHGAERRLEGRRRAAPRGPHGMASAARVMGERVSGPTFCTLELVVQQLFEQHYEGLGDVIWDVTHRSFDDLTL